MSECFLYIAKMEIPSSCGDIVKVGISQNPKSRIATLRTGSAFPINFFATLRLPNRNLAREFEREFHCIEAPFRLEGEWFRFCAPAALCNIGISLANFAFAEYGRSKVPEFLAWSGLSEDDIQQAILFSSIPDEGGRT